MLSFHNVSITTVYREVKSFFDTCDNNKVLISTNGTAHNLVGAVVDNCKKRKASPNTLSGLRTSLKY